MAQRLWSMRPRVWFGGFSFPFSCAFGSQLVSSEGCVWPARFSRRNFCAPQKRMSLAQVRAQYVALLCLRCRHFASAWLGHFIFYLFSWLHGLISSVLYLLSPISISVSICTILSILYLVSILYLSCLYIVSLYLCIFLSFYLVLVSSLVSCSYLVSCFCSLFLFVSLCISPSTSFLILCY